MCGPKFRPPPYNKTREDANLLPISKPFVSLRALFKTNQCFLQCKLGCISTFWQPIDKPKGKIHRKLCILQKRDLYLNQFSNKKGLLQNLRARKSTLSGPHIPVPTFPLSTPPGRVIIIMTMTSVFYLNVIVSVYCSTNQIKHSFSIYMYLKIKHYIQDGIVWTIMSRQVDVQYTWLVKCFLTFYEIDNLIFIAIFGSSAIQAFKWVQTSLV